MQQYLFKITKIIQTGEEIPIIQQENKNRKQMQEFYKIHVTTTTGKRQMKHRDIYTQDNKGLTRNRCA